eukprot:Gb_09830 [translate_table: standard]
MAAGCRHVGQRMCTNIVGSAPMGTFFSAPDGVEFSVKQKGPRLASCGIPEMPTEGHLGLDLLSADRLFLSSMSNSSCGLMHLFQCNADCELESAWELMYGGLNMGFLIRNWEGGECPRGLAYARDDDDNDFEEYDMEAVSQIYSMMFMENFPVGFWALAYIEILYSMTGSVRWMKCRHEISDCVAARL